jgi:hypothetical protein
MRKLFLLFLIVFTNLIAAQANADCHQVGGAISTNFIDSTTTFGSANGDLSGGVGVTVLALTENSGGTLTFHNQHHWVTASGDTINTDPAYATGFPTGISGLYAASYTDGIVITGGTGKFKNAHGKVYAWGAVNTATNEVVLRYEGSVCFA